MGFHVSFREGKFVELSTPNMDSMPLPVATCQGVPVIIQVGSRHFPNVPLLLGRGLTHVRSILFGDTMVLNIEEDYILLLGYSILYKEYNLTRFNHQKSSTHVRSKAVP